MKKILVLLVVGILMLGALAVTEESSEDSPREFQDLLDRDTPNSFGNPTPDGGGGDGAGGIPG